MKLIIQIIILLFGSAPPCWANPFGFSPQSTFINLEYSSLITSKNFDDYSNVLPLAGNNQMTEHRWSLFGSYDFSDHWGLFTELNYKSEDAINAGAELTRSAMTDGTIGAGLLVFSGFLDVIPEISVNIPFYPAPGSDNNVVLGDGSMVLTAKIRGSHKWGWFWASVYAGYQYVSQGLSSQIPLGLQGRGQWGNFFSEIKFYGAVSLDNDQDTGNPNLRNAITGRLDGGSYLYYSVNPSWTNILGRVGYFLSPPIFISLGADQTLFGQRSAFGTRILASIGWAD